MKKITAPFGHTDKVIYQAYFVCQIHASPIERPYVSYPRVPTFPVTSSRRLTAQSVLWASREIAILGQFHYSRHDSMAHFMRTHC